MKKKKTLSKHRISSAYDAYQFLVRHPAFRRKHRQEITEEEASVLRKKGFLIASDDDQYFKESRHLSTPAIEEGGLLIFYTKVNAKGRVSDDPKQNVYPECWLEFGPMEYLDGVPFPSHDMRLDTGAPTFDAALVNLARLVRRHYGDYTPTERQDDCGKPKCADCCESNEWLKAQGLSS